MALARRGLPHPGCRAGHLSEIKMRSILWHFTQMTVNRHDWLAFFLIQNSERITQKPILTKNFK
jgi:hypothetical protein